MSSPSKGAGKGWYDPNRDGANSDVPNSDTSAADQAARLVTLSGTPTGVSFSLDGLTVEAHARTLLNDPDILTRVTEAIHAEGYVGDPTPALLVYIALTSRFLERPINLALVAESSAGKNMTIDVALKLVPKDAYYLVGASSPRSIIYTDEDLSHRVVVFKEADSIPSDAPAAAAIRALAEDNELRYEVTIPTKRTGQFEPRKITKPGPTGLVTTSTDHTRDRYGVFFWAPFGH